MKPIPLTKGMVAPVDDEDFDFINQWRWHVSLSIYGGAYAKRVEIIRKQRVLFAMHRVLMRAAEGAKVDHIDRNGLNNQKSNLRIASQLQNCGNRKLDSDNTSGFKGVSWSEPHQKWRVQIGHNYKNHYIGIFASVIEAAAAYDDAALRMKGEFAATNKRLGLL